MAVKRILLLGNPALYESSQPVRRDELEAMRSVAKDLHDTLMAFREEHGDLSELLQHECDHLDGILAVARAVDAQSFALKSERHLGIG